MGYFFGHTYCITTSNSRHFHVLYLTSKIAAFLLDTQFVSEFSKQGTIKKQEEKTCEEHTQLLRRHFVLSSIRKSTMKQTLRI